MTGNIRLIPYSNTAWELMRLRGRFLISRRFHVHMPLLHIWSDCSPDVHRVVLRNPDLRICLIAHKKEPIQSDRLLDLQDMT